MKRKLDILKLKGGNESSYWREIYRCKHFNFKKRKDPVLKT